MFSISACGGTVTQNGTYIQVHIKEMCHFIFMYFSLIENSGTFYYTYLFFEEMAKHIEQYLTMVAYYAICTLECDISICALFFIFVLFIEIMLI